MQLGTTITST